MSENNKIKARQPLLNLNLPVIGTLLVVIAAMLAIWRPWQSGGITDRSIDVTGQATVTAEPDEFVFYPSYQHQNADKDAALTQAANKHQEIITKLKQLGVPENNIKSDTSGFSDGTFRPLSDGELITYNSTITVTVRSRAQAQTVQDYLMTTSPAGIISPVASFSEAKRKELENEARDKAIKDARAKADQSARNLGFKVGKVKSVVDGAGFDSNRPMPLAGGERMMALDAGASLAVQPGENKLNYSVTVTYYLY